MPGRIGRVNTDAELVIWDFDGTLADTRGVILATFGALWEERALGVCDLDAVRAAIGLPLSDVLADLSGIGDADGVAGLVADYRRIFAELVPTMAELFPGIAELLGRVTDDGRAQAITTSRGRASLEPMLDAFGITDRFAVILTDEDVERPKPDPEMARRAIASAGVDATRSLLVGDTIYDLEMGRGAGAATCGVTWGNQTVDTLLTVQPDHLVDTVDELAKVIGLP